MKLITINHFWKLTNNCNLTFDWCLVVDRGIPCEQHTQIFSHHVTNPPDFETVEKFIENNSDKINDRINKFVDLIRVQKSEAISNEFCYQLLKEIIEDCEEIEGERL